jgi:hypothetical protein
MVPNIVPNKDKGGHIIVGGRAAREVTNGLQDIETDSMRALSGRALESVGDPLKAELLACILRFHNAPGDDEQGAAGRHQAC